MSCHYLPFSVPSCKYLQPRGCPSTSVSGTGVGGGEGGPEPSPHPSSPPPSYATDDDIVFEDFARLRLKGMKDEDYDDQFC